MMETKVDPSSEVYGKSQGSADAPGSEGNSASCIPLGHTCTDNPIDPTIKTDFVRRPVTCTNSAVFQNCTPQDDPGMDSSIFASQKEQSNPMLLGCSYCKKVFKRLANLNQHMRIHTGEKPHQCKYCQKFFRHSSSLTQHERMHTGEKPYQCMNCGKCFSTCSALRSHKSIHEDSEKLVRSWSCSHCEKCFIRPSLLRKHEKSHSGERPFQCQYCEKRYISMSHVKEHERKHTGDLPFKCEQCQKTFTSNSNLKKHKQIHSGKKPYQCTYCGKRFTCAPSLACHERVHTGEKPFQCRFCDKTFAQQSQVRVHERTHTGEKPYHCSFCGRGFSVSSARKRHERTHTGEKPFQCSFCKLCFSALSTLKRHETIHTGEKPYKCMFCMKCFRSSSNVREHERRSHGGRTTKEAINQTASQVSRHCVGLESGPIKSNIALQSKPISNPMEQADGNTSPEHAFQTQDLFPQHLHVEKLDSDVSTAMPVCHNNSVELADRAISEPKTLSSHPTSVCQGELIQNPDEPLHQSYACSSAIEEDAECESRSKDETLDLEGEDAVCHKDMTFFPATQACSTLDLDVGEPHCSLDTGLLPASQQCTDAGISTDHADRPSALLHAKHNVTTTGNVADVEIDNEEWSQLAKEGSSVDLQDTEEKFSELAFRSAEQGLRCTELANHGMAQTDPGQNHTVASGVFVSRLSLEVPETDIKTEKPNPEKVVFLPSSSDQEYALKEMLKPEESEPLLGATNRAEELANVKSEQPAGVGQADFLPETSNCASVGNAESEVAECLHIPAAPKLVGVQTAQLEEAATGACISPHNQGKELGSPTEVGIAIVPKDCTRMVFHWNSHNSAEHYGSEKIGTWVPLPDTDTENTSKWQCLFCGKYLQNSYHLKRHERVHTGEKPFQCSYCGKYFRCPSNVRWHERIHTGTTKNSTKDKPWNYKCSHCGKCFNQAGNLEQHELIHKVKKTHQCGYCERLFSSASQLREHERTHTAEKRFKCSHCEKCFSKACDRTQHERMHTLEKQAMEQADGNTSPEHAFQTQDLFPQHLHVEKLDSDVSTAMPVGHNNSVELAGMAISEHKTLSSNPTSVCQGELIQNPDEPLHQSYACSSAIEEDAERESRSKDETLDLEHEDAVCHKDMTFFPATQACSTLDLDVGEPHCSLDTGLLPASQQCADAGISTDHADRPSALLHAKHNVTTTGNVADVEIDNEEWSQLAKEGTRSVDLQDTEEKFSELAFRSAEQGLRCTELANHGMAQTDPDQNHTVASGVFVSRLSLEVPETDIKTEKPNPEKVVFLPSSSDQEYALKEMLKPEESEPLLGATNRAEELANVKSEQPAGVGQADFLPETSNCASVGNAESEVAECLHIPAAPKLVGVQTAQLEEAATGACISPHNQGKELGSPTEVGIAIVPKDCTRMVFHWNSHNSAEHYGSEKIGTWVPLPDTDTENTSKWQCLFCGKYLQNSYHLKRHERVHTGEKPFQCSYCGKYFRCPSNVRWHERIHTGTTKNSTKDKPWNYKCSHCGKCFNQAGNLEQHELIHKVKKTHQCGYCERRLSSASQLREHERTHTAEKRFKCSHCEKCFSKAYDRTQHERMHTLEKLYQCAFCGKRFPRSKNLKQHEITHTDDKPYRCQYCEKSFGRREQVESHQRTHTGEKPFKCRFCEKCFSGANYLARHEEQHAGKKYHQCSFCGKCYGHRFSLKNHERTHTETPWECQYCDKTFSRPDSIKAHLRIHTGEKPFSCSYNCGRSFSALNSLKQHERVHAEKNYKCAHCGERFRSPSSAREHEKKLHAV